jgi:anti-sigma factor RsiW
MSLTRHIEPEDLALFAMQLLGKDEARAVAAHVEECPECRQQLAEVQGDLAVYAHAVDMHSPPALARERLMKQVAREKKVVPIERVPAEPAYPSRVEPVLRTTGLGSGAYLTEDEPQRSTLSKLAAWL